MSLAAGSRLGPYTIVSKLGEGGMGEVYRARDTRLDRDVAIKVAAEQFSERFEREAKAIASLNHANICQIYDVGPNYLVMEVVEGAALTGPLAYDEALPILRQLIDGIEAAHDKGIVHRDLKPANIRITHDGTVKILDFGLAKALAPEGAPNASMDVANSPTLTVDGTRAGTILGTAAYMAPEQARGRTADRRADIWAFGVVAYELLAGAQPFGGESVADILGAVLSQEPDWSRVPPRAHPWLTWCLEKDRRQRVQAIGDVRRWLERDPTVLPAPVMKAETSRAGWVLAGLGGLLAVALAWPALTHLREEPSGLPPVVRTDVMTPPTGDPGSFALSPDGRALVYSGNDGRRRQLYLRRLDRDAAEPLAETEGASFPFWSPDSRSIAFADDGKLKRLDLEGGRPTVLADLSIVRSAGSWSVQGEILFAGGGGPGPSDALNLVPAGGGAARPVTTLADGESNHRSPHFLPDGRRFLYTVTGAMERAGLYLGDLDGSAPRRLAFVDSRSVAYGHPGWLLFEREDTLVAQRLDLTAMALTGEAIAVAGPVGSGAFSVSSVGTIAYRRPSGMGRTQLTWFDRSGRRLGSMGEPDNGEMVTPAVSPDGRTVAVSRVVDNNRDIWLFDATRAMRLTFDPAVEEQPVWSPDGQRIVFRSMRSGLGDLYQASVTGAGAEMPILASPQGEVPNSWSRDGRLFVYHVVAPQTARDIYVLPFEGDRPGPASPLLRTPANEGGGILSPDGKWLAYFTTDEGQNGLFIRGLEESSARWQVTGSVSTARWSPDGRELYYISGEDGYLMAVPITVRGRALDLGAHVRLFAPRLPTPRARGASDQFDVARDGRFLVNVLVDETEQPSISLIQNWRPPDGRR